MKKISAKKIAQALYEETKDLDKKQIKLRVENLLNYLIRSKNLRLADEIVAAFDAYSKNQEGILDVELFSAKAIGAEIKESLANKLKAEQKVKKINFIEEQDASLLGGLIIKIDDTIYDNSLRTRLESLRQQIQP
ncbi:MAG: ATP synthase F1 subunit delta [Candidatus Parcubacteria bacterium]|nr:ATP synthase F1 subunit delta [Candidatus Parcubacteria bacterium]